MKSGNYDELMDRFYAGKLNAAEIGMLKGEGLLDDEDVFYAEGLIPERDLRLDWNFEDFMNEIPATKVVALAGSGVQMKRLIAAAAIVGTMLIAYIFWPQQQKRKEIVSVPAVNNQVDSSIKISASPALPVNEIKNSELTVGNVKENAKESKKYTVKTRQQSLPQQKKGSAKDKEESTRSVDDFIVVVDGKSITNEADALAIMRESLSLVSRNLTNTVRELKPITRIKIKL